MADQASSSVDKAEIERFEAIADAWWDPEGKFAPLHALNPPRLEYIRARLCRHFHLDGAGRRPLEGLDVLDIGCGGGLLCEPMARLGATVTGTDASDLNIRIAADHAAGAGLGIDYRATIAEAMAATGETYDVVLNMEVVEHVADVPLFLGACAALLRPGGLTVVATLNRTLKSLALAVIGAEYILRWLPRGTHDWNKFLKPDELRRELGAAGLKVGDLSGISYHPLAGTWALSRDTSVNYMICAAKEK